MKLAALPGQYSRQFRLEPYVRVSLYNRDIFDFDIFRERLENFSTAKLSI